MKKILSLILLVSILFLCCTQANAKSIASLYFTDIKQYNDYFADKKMPKYFVTAEALRIIGEFDYFYTSTDFSEKNCKAYYYTLVDINGIESAMWIYHEPDGWLSNDVMQMPGNMSTMAYIYPYKQKGCIERSGFRFYYVQDYDFPERAALHCIEWKVGKTIFSLSVDDENREYPMDKEETFMKLLLSGSDENLERAMSMFETAMTDSNVVLTQTKKQTKTIIIGGCVVFAGGVAIIYYKRYNRRRKESNGFEM